MQTTTTLLALAGLAAKVAALGNAGVVNNCGFDVNLNAVPAFGNGLESQAEVLSSGDSWTQEWTSLLLGGWSIKLNPSTTSSSVMQFEYTYSTAAPDALWFDLSYVNGNPFSGNWLIESSDASTCPVKHSAYLYPTDDANGMQAECTPAVNITVTLCPSSDETSGSSAVSSSAWPASTSSSTSSSTSTSTSISTSTSTSTSTTAEATSSAAIASPSLHFGIIDDKQVNAPTATSTTSTSAAPTTSSTSSPSPTTFSTQAAPSEAASPTVDDGVFLVTAYDTVIATEVVTVYGHGSHHRRHQHGHRHAQN